MGTLEERIKRRAEKLEKAFRAMGTPKPDEFNYLVAEDMVRAEMEAKKDVEEKQEKAKAYDLIEKPKEKVTE